MQALIRLFEEHFKESPTHTVALQGAGSNRKYFRMQHPDGQTFIGTVGTNVKENQCFIYLSRHFEKQNLPVPHIIAESKDGTRYLQTDHGDNSLFKSLEKGRQNGGDYNDTEVSLIKKVIECLPHIQLKGDHELDYEQCLTSAQFTKEIALFDLNYFKYCFLKTTDLPFDEIALQKDFEAIASDLAENDQTPQGFLYRDFQARNVLLTSKDTPIFIDFQGGMRGPLQYDLASFLWQASAKYSKELRQNMIQTYLEELSRFKTIDQAAFVAQLNRFVLFRMLQVLGAYGLRGYFEQKKHFIDSIPSAIENIRELLEEGVATAYPYLESTLQSMVNLPQFKLQKEKVSSAPFLPEAQSCQKLYVTVYSFSFKKGIPQDESGNGGGYVFDCRGVHNPGKYDAYKPLTGLDESVIQFLESKSDIADFLNHVYALAEKHVKVYLERGFTHLMFSFGCTGGQHRSVYSAQHLAEHLNRVFGIEVKLHHREQNIHQHFLARQQP